MTEPTEKSRIRTFPFVSFFFVCSVISLPFPTTIPVFSIRGHQCPFLTVSPTFRHLHEVCAITEHRSFYVKQFSTELAPDLVKSAAYVDRQPSLIGAAVINPLNDLGSVCRRT